MEKTSGSSRIRGQQRLSRASRSPQLTVLSPDERRTARARRERAAACPTRSNKDRSDGLSGRSGPRSSSTPTPAHLQLAPPVLTPRADRRDSPMQFLDDGQVRLLLDEVAVMQAVADAMTELSAGRGSSRHRVTAAAPAGSLRLCLPSARRGMYSRPGRPRGHPLWRPGAVLDRTDVFRQVLDLARARRQDRRCGCVRADR
jgi:hypothetical protein